jgi:hypothetical protein
MIQNIAVAAAFGAVVVLSGCSGEMTESELAQAEYQEHLQEQYEPTEEQLQAQADAAFEEYAATHWACFYDPTMNDNWHDDVLCTNGIDSTRPQLLLDDPFIEYDEIMAAAAAYEAQLNG